MNEVVRQRKSLGRGLSALLSDDDAPAAQVSGDTNTVPISKIAANPDQPRRDFDDKELDALAASIKEKGLLQPILVRSNPKASDGYEIIAGERRWRAAQRAQLHEVPVILREMEDAEVLEVAIIENVQRVDLNPLEEAEGYQRLMDSFGYTQDTLAQMVSKSRSHIANMTRLLKLPKSVRNHLRDGALSAGHARALIGFDGAKKLADKAVRDGMSVRDVEKRVKVKSGAGGGKSKKSKSRAVVIDPDTIALEADLSAALNADVAIDHRGEGGRIVITYDTLDHLDALCEKFGLPSE